MELMFAATLCKVKDCTSLQRIEFIDHAGQKSDCDKSEGAAGPPKSTTHKQCNVACTALSMHRVPFKLPVLAGVSRILTVTVVLQYPFFEIELRDLPHKGPKNQWRGLTNMLAGHLPLLAL